MSADERVGLRDCQWTRERASARRKGLLALKSPSVTCGARVRHRGMDCNSGGSDSARAPGPSREASGRQVARPDKGGRQLFSAGRQRPAFASRNKTSRRPAPPLALRPPRYRAVVQARAVLDRLCAKHPDMVLVHGASPKGAELIASKWADARNVTQIAFRPDWTRHGGAVQAQRSTSANDADRPRCVHGFGHYQQSCRQSAWAGHPGVALPVRRISQQVVKISLT